MKHPDPSRLTLLTTGVSMAATLEMCSFSWWLTCKERRRQDRRQHKVEREKLCVVGLGMGAGGLRVRGGAGRQRLPQGGTGQGPGGMHAEVLWQQNPGGTMQTAVHKLTRGEMCGGGGGGRGGVGSRVAGEC